MKYITIVLLLFLMACENKAKKETTDTGPVTSTKDMEVYIDEDSLVTLAGTSEIWVKRVFPEGTTDEVISVGTDGSKSSFTYDGIASLMLFDCKQNIYIMDEIYYFMGDKVVSEMENRKERLGDKSTWSKVEPGNYIEKVSEFVCKPEAEPEPEPEK